MNSIMEFMEQCFSFVRFSRSPAVIIMSLQWTCAMHLNAARTCRHIFMYAGQRKVNRKRQQNSQNAFKTLVYVRECQYPDTTDLSNSVPLLCSVFFFSDDNLFVLYTFCTPIAGVLRLRCIKFAVNVFLHNTICWNLTLLLLLNLYRSVDLCFFVAHQNPSLLMKNLFSMNVCAQFANANEWFHTFPTLKFHSKRMSEYGSSFFVFILDKWNENSEKYFLKDAKHQRAATTQRKLISHRKWRKQQRIALHS